MIKFFATTDVFNGQTKVGIRVGAHRPGAQSVVLPIEFQTIETGQQLPYFIDGPQPYEGGYDFGAEFLRAALNCAWDMGLRPDGFNDTRESMKATNAHLQDFRAIAFGKLGIEKP